MSKELKPCPFCGSNDTNANHINVNRGHRKYVFCNECSAEGPFADGDSTEQAWSKAVDKWNCRAAPSQTEGAEPVAWRYVRNGNRVEFHAHRLDHFYWDDQKQEYLKGTPLYVHPSQSAEAASNSVESGGFKTAMSLSAGAAAPAQPDAHEEDSLEWKLSCVIDYATGGKLSKPGWALATINDAIDEHVNALYEEWSEDGDDDEESEEPDPLHVANERGEGEPVAWRYERNGNRVEFHAHRLDHFYWDDIKQDYIKGTPLYLRPCRPAKVIPNSVESDGFKADARLLPSAAAPTSPTPAQEGKT